LDDSIFLVGGLTAGKAHNAVLKFDAEHDSWSELAPLQFARTNAGVCAVGGKLYVVGGHSESLLDSVERYDEVSTDTHTHTHTHTHIYTHTHTHTHTHTGEQHVDICSPSSDGD
jgi:N-acetylneuraminic acid mutarotase